MPRILQRMVNCPYLLCLNHGVHSSLSPVFRFPAPWFPAQYSAVPSGYPLTRELSRRKSRR